MSDHRRRRISIIRRRWLISRAAFFVMVFLSVAGILTAAFFPFKTDHNDPKTIGIIEPEQTSAEENISPAEEKEEPTDPAEIESKQENASGKESASTKETAHPESSSEPVETTEEVHTYPAISTTATRIWIGDSRMVGIANCGIIDPVFDAFIVKGTTAFNWFESYAVPRLREYLSTGKSYDVIVQMGINDSANNAAGWHAYFAGNYNSLMRALSAEYPNAAFWFISVGKNAGLYNGSEERIMTPEEVNPYAERFNEIMKEGEAAVYLPVGELIEEKSLSYADGVHYSVSTNRWIYQYVLDAIAGIPVEQPSPKEETENSSDPVETEDATYSSETEEPSVSESSVEEEYPSSDEP